MKHYNIKFFNIYGACVYDDTILSPNAFRALDSGRFVYLKQYPDLRDITLEKGIHKFTVEVAP